MIDTEIGIIELNLSLGCLDNNNLKKAHLDTEEFKKETWEKAKKLSKKNKCNTLVEYKKLINFI